MSSLELSAYEDAFRRLPRNDQLVLAAKLIELARATEDQSPRRPTDLHEFYGTVHFGVDGVEYQRSVRDEWN